MAKPFQYHFEWDPSKARENYCKHGIAFDRAATIFHDANALSEFDAHHSDQEERWITMGQDQTGTILTRIIHERFCCNREFAAATSLDAAGAASKQASSPLGRSTYCFKCASLPRGSARLSRWRLRDFATNLHE